MTDDERHHGVSTTHLTVHPANSGKHIIRTQRHIDRTLQLMSENV